MKYMHDKLIIMSVNTTLKSDQINAIVKVCVVSAFALPPGGYCAEIGQALSLIHISEPTRPY